MTRTLAVAAAAALMLAAGCSSDGSSDADPAPDPSTTTGSPTSTSAPEGPAVVLRSSPGFFSCQIQHGKLVEAISMRVARPVTLQSADLVGATNIRVGEATVVARPEGSSDSSSSLPGAEPKGKIRRDLAWDQRQPLAGAEVQPGLYYYFLPIEVAKAGAHLDGSRVTWSEDGVDGASDSEWSTDFGKQCE
jgi:hypothetical protein